MNTAMELRGEPAQDLAALQRDFARWCSNFSDGKRRAGDVQTSFDRAGSDFFAVSLLRKRRRAVAALLPNTRQQLRADFEQAFAAYARTFNPQGIWKHHDDAVAFGRYLLARQAEFGFAAACLRCEIAEATAAKPRRYFAWVWLPRESAGRPGSRRLYIWCRPRARGRLRRFRLL